MAIHDLLMERAKKASKSLVLPEGNDPRIVAASNRIIEKGIARSITVLGSETEILRSCLEAGIKKRKFNVINPSASDKIEFYAKEYCKHRSETGHQISTKDSLDVIKNRLFYGAMMVKLEEVDGMVAGSIASTADLLKAAFTVVGTAPGIKTASSSFIMELTKPTPGGESVLTFADCVVVPDPDAETMVDIALAAAKTHRSLVGVQPRVAFISFSTKGSAKHPMLKKVCNAAEIMKKTVADQKLDIVVDGEMQFDAAIVPEIAASKCPESPIKGRANVMIFPDINVGNTCYKITERLAGATALGPALQGLAYPINDLSRGCSVDNIVITGAITICQSTKRVWRKSFRSNGSSFGEGLR